MKLDAGLITQDLTKAGAAAHELETLGFDGGFTFEGQHDPFFPLVLAARETERLELATAIAIAFARNPMLLANIGYDLQVISGGRFILGLGSQIKPHIVKRFSSEWSRPAARMREFVQAVRAIWSCWNDGTRLDFRGEFYTHTLMTPFFNPGPNPHGCPPIFVAGVGPVMTEVAGEVADGFFVHPFHTSEFMAQQTLPALERGAKRAGRTPSDVAISCQLMVALGNDDEELARALDAVRAQIAFYASTPAYRGVLECHGREGIHPELNRLSKRGGWQEMSALIDDELLEKIAICGTPADVGARLRQRCPFAERVSVIASYPVPLEWWADLVASFRVAEV